MQNVTGLSPVAAAPKVRKRMSQSFKLFLMITPFLLLVFIFSYFPLYGWVYSFFNYKPPLKLSQCDYVGLQWFKMMFNGAGQIKQIVVILRNTFAISGLNILTSVLPLIFAIFLSEMKAVRFKKFVQTFTTIPNFISWVLVYSVAFSLFSSSGMVNNLGVSLGIFDQPVKFLDSDSYTWIKMCVWNLWKSLGWNAIMYIAAIAGIDQELYEAATVDGAGRFRLMWHITVPSLMPTYIVLLLLTVAGFLNSSLDQFYVFQNAFNKDHIQVLDLYVFNISVGGQNMYSFATALSMLKSIISVVLLFSVNGISKLTRGETIV
jgi:multiple sugar transport system permease protein/putative aldouronate transport system permease protein